MVGFKGSHFTIGASVRPVVLAALTAGAGLALGFGAHPAMAAPFNDGDTFTVSQPFPDVVVNSGDGLFQNGSAQVGFTFSPNSGSSLRAVSDVNDMGEPLQAGQFTVDITPTGGGPATRIQAYCGDIFDFLNLPAGYTFHTLNSAALTALITNGNLALDGMTANKGIASAALQLAIWEILYDPEGTFSADAATDPAVIAAAEDDLNKIQPGGEWEDPVPNFLVGELLDPGNQTLYFDYDPPPPSDVPEPAGLAVLGVSLVGLGVLRRRRTA